MQIRRVTEEKQDATVSVARFPRWLAGNDVFFSFVFLIKDWFSRERRRGLQYGLQATATRRLPEQKFCTAGLKLKVVCAHVNLN